MATVHRTPGARGRLGHTDDVGWLLSSTQTWVTISGFVAVLGALFAVVQGILRSQGQRFDQVERRLARMDERAG